MSVTEAMIGYDFLYSLLSADSGLTTHAPGGIWRGMAKPNTVTPFVVMSLQSAPDVVTMNAYRVMVNALFLIKAVGPASATPTLALAAADIDRMLGKPPISGTVTGGYISSCYRESSIMLDELVNGVLWTNIGGNFRMTIQQTT